MYAGFSFGMLVISEVFNGGRLHAASRISFGTATAELRGRGVFNPNIEILTHQNGEIQPNPLSITDKRLADHFNTTYVAIDALVNMDCYQGK